jgi:hypothetical protein
MANIEYEIKMTLPSEAPKGKLSYIEDGDEVLADSGFIAMHLKGSGYRVESSRTGTICSNAAFAWGASLLGPYFSRWQYTGAKLANHKEAMFGTIPLTIRELTAIYYHHTIKQQIHGHGMGCHKAEENFALDLASRISMRWRHAWGQEVFAGPTLTTLDASTFGILINTIGCPIESPIKEHGLSKTNLVNFIYRIKADYYPELQAALYW